MRPRSDVHALSSPPSVIIQSGTAPWDFDLQILWDHRELLYFLVWRDIKVRYKQTVVGIAWALLQPLAIALSIILLLGRVVQLPTGDLPYPVFAYAGMVVWQFLSQAVSESSNSLLANERLVTKVYFPRLLLPLSTVLASSLDFALNLLVLGGFLAWFQIMPQVRLLLLPVFAALIGVTALGIGLWLSALNVKYRDVRYTVSFLIQFWFFTTPIAYPMSAVPERWQQWYTLNPMVGAVEGFRWALCGTGEVPIHALVVSFAVTFIVFVSGLYYFHRTEDTFADFI
jgi:lipopolysaccharide transport system permease protein